MGLAVLAATLLPLPAVAAVILVEWSVDCAECGLAGEGTFEFDDAFLAWNQVWLEEAGVTPLSLEVTSGDDAVVWSSSASSHVFQVDLPNQTGMFVPVWEPSIPGIVGPLFAGPSVVVSCVDAAQAPPCTADRFRIVGPFKNLARVRVSGAAPLGIEATGTGTTQFFVRVVPEPATAGLFAAGLVCLYVARAAQRGRSSARRFQPVSATPPRVPPDAIRPTERLR